MNNFVPYGEEQSISIYDYLDIDLGSIAAIIEEYRKVYRLYNNREANISYRSGWFKIGGGYSSYRKDKIVEMIARMWNRVVIKAHDEMKKAPDGIPF